MSSRTLARAVLLLSALAASGLLVTSTAAANETRYQYDALGRLVHAEQVNGAGNHDVRYTYDAAGNRVQQVVTGSANGSATGVIVAPLGGGFVVIPFDRE